MTKKCQKMTKIIKTQKQEKVKKYKNTKSDKTQKIKIIKKWQNWKVKNDEKSVKNRPPLKNPKMSDKWPKVTLCEIRAAWSGVFWVPGGTTGPGFKAEIDTPLS